MSYKKSLALHLINPLNAWEHVAEGYSLALNYHEAGLSTKARAWLWKPFHIISACLIAPLAIGYSLAVLLLIGYPSHIIRTIKELKK